MPHPSTPKKTNKQTTQNNLKNFKSTTPKPVAESMLSVTPVAQAQDVWQRFVVKNSFKAVEIDNIPC